LCDYIFDVLLVIFEIQELLTCCHKSVWLPVISYINHIGGVKARMLISSVVDCGVKPLSGQTRL